jgi:predicted RNase H-like nuclease
VLAALAGVDGCPAGWVVALEDLENGALSVRVAPDFAGVLALEPTPALVAIDIPIGLPERGARPSDRAARALLGPGATSRVFPAPPRGVLASRSYDEANRLRRELEGKGLSRQTYGILAKIREVDDALALHTRARVYEVHPELSFRAMAGSARGLAPKKTPEGRDARAELVRRHFPSLDPRVLSERPPRVRADDLLDAFAALWSARRIHAGAETVLPDPPPRDRLGRPMAIRF